MSSTPRIDTLRNQLNLVRSLLDDVDQSIEALHSLAYERAPSVDDLGVSKSRPEGYGLLHGDERARSAYAALGREVFTACGQITGAARRALKVVNAGDEKGDNRRSPVTIGVVEHLEAIDRQGRRAARGEFDPGRTMIQPTRAGSEKTAAGKIRQLEAELKRSGRGYQQEIRRLEAQVRRQARAIEVRDARLAELEAATAAKV
jgi:hypothetical protein